MNEEMSPFEKREKKERRNILLKGIYVIGCSLVTLGILAYNSFVYKPSKTETIGDINKDGIADIVEIKENGFGHPKYKILFGDEQNGKITYNEKKQGLTKEGLPIDYSVIERVALKYIAEIKGENPEAKITEKSILTKIANEIMEEKK